MVADLGATVHVLAATHHDAVYHINLLQAIVIGLIQGITELFPISSLGHTVLVPSWIGGTWATLVRQESQSESPYLAFIVGLHMATAIVLLGFYFREWLRLIGGFFTAIPHRRHLDDHEKLAWLIVIATVPVGVLGLVFEHQFRELFAKPVAAAAFLMANGLILLAGEVNRRRGGETASAGVPAAVGRRRFRDRHIVAIDDEAVRRLGGIGVLSTAVIGASQALALLAGISREGVAMVGGMFRGLDRENALRFSFLLSTPVIFAAGALKLSDALGPLGHGIRGELVAGALATGATSLFAVVFLSRWFRTRTLVPFAGWCLVFGLASVIRFGIF